MAEGGRGKGGKERPYKRFGDWASHVDGADSDLKPSECDHVFIDKCPVASLTELQSHSDR